MFDSRSRESKLVHAMTVDVEDYFHVAAFNGVIKPEQWSQWPCRVENNTRTLLRLFNEKSIRATFFVLGWVAERYPSLIQEIVASGHEIASHGYSHQLVYSQTPAVFREETKKSKEILEDIVQKPVDGYRAASYSITKKSMWALNILVELGFKWDSSIFPIYHDNYGVPGSPRRPYSISLEEGKELIEYPLTTTKLMGLTLPAAGGGYFRQYPYCLSRWFFSRASENGSIPGIFYLHPWEIDPDQPRIEEASLKSKFRHYTNLSRCLPRLTRMIDDFNFGSVSESLASVQTLEAIDIRRLV